MIELATRVCPCGQRLVVRLFWKAARYEYLFLPANADDKHFVSHCPACNRRLVYRDLSGIV